MANRIFTNGEEGKILTSVGNRIIKQPYEFGYAFQNRMGLNNYIVIDNINISLVPSTEMFWYSDTSSVLEENITARKSLSNNNYNRVAYNTSTYLTRNSSGSSPANPIFNQNPITFVQQSSNFFSVSLETTQSGIARCNAGTFTGINSTNLLDSDTIGILIGAIKTSVSSGLTPSGYSINKIGRYVVFNRALSNNEMLYFFNNKLGNDLQSPVGLEIDLHNDFAEVINILGVDQPCVRDYSGNNRHGIIMNLPAGTPQQKVDYANANLFVPFLT